MSNYNDFFPLPSSNTTYASVAPISPTIGDVWYDTSTSLLKSYSGVSWVITGGGTITYGPVSPTAQRIGDLWYDDTNMQLFVWNSTAWVSATAI